MDTLQPKIPAVSIDSNISNAVAGTSFAIPYSKQGVSVAYQLIYTGVVTAVSIIFQLSMDNSNWAPVDTSTNVSGEYVVLGGLVGNFVRLYHTSRTGGTNVKGSIMLGGL
jgi:hypothetical protein